jgi:acyl dehydratase
VIKVKASSSKPDRGVVTVRQELINQDHETVMSLEGKSMHRRRP